MAVYNTFVSSFPNSQDGYLVGVGPAWNDTAGWLFAGAAPNDWIGLQFEILPQAYDATTGVPLDPNGFSALSITLYSLNGTFGFNAGTLTPYVVPEEAPLPYSDARQPGTRSEILAGTPLAIAAGGGAGVAYTITLDPGVIAPYVRSTLWRGIISISLQWTGAALGRGWSSSEGAILGDPTQVPILTTTEYAFHTGYMNFYQEERGYAARDDRLGTPILSTRRVRDQYLPNLWVHPDDVDPEDPPPSYRPNPREGANEDERDV